MSGVSPWVGPISFTTPCAAALPPFLEDFSGGSIPACWSQSAISGDGWRFSGSPAYDAASNGRPAGSFAWIDFSGTDQGTILELPNIDVSSDVALVNTEAV